MLGLMIDWQTSSVGQSWLEFLLSSASLSTCPSITTLLPLLCETMPQELFGLGANLLLVGWTI